MRFGMVFGMVTPPGSGMTWADAVRDFVAVAPELEQLGYDSLQVTEHHFQADGHNPSPLMLLSAAAAVTERITLGTNVLLVPLYNPVKLAEDVAVLDNIANGRVTLGVAPGYVREEFAGLGVSYPDRASRFEEYLDVLQAAWTQETFEFDGRFVQVPPTRLSPKPVQSPHPPIWYGVSGPKLLRKAAARGCPLVCSPRHGFAELAEHLAAYDAAAAEFGYQPTERPVMRGAFLAETREQAERIAAPAVTHLFRELYGKKSASGERVLRADDGSVISDADTVSFETFADRYLIGTPDDAIAQLTRLRDELGVTELQCWTQLPGITRDQAMASARLFAKEVIPAFAD
jgi:probable F420-dependent oxidoreductase